MSVTVKITKRDQAAFKKDALLFLKNKDIAIDRALDATANKIALDAKKIMQDNKTNFDGRLWNSIIPENNSTAKAKSRKVATNAGYGKWIEFGRPPGDMPPFNVIADWARRKLKVPKDRLYIATKFIRKSIFERGTKAQPFLGPALLQNKRTLAKAIRKAFKQK